MADNPQEVWVAVDPAGRIRAFDSYDTATDTLNAHEDVWLECVTLEHASQRALDAPVSRFPAPEVHPDPQGADQTPTRDAGTPQRSWIAPPILTLRGRALYDPWNPGGDAA